MTGMRKVSLNINLIDFKINDGKDGAGFLLSVVRLASVVPSGCRLQSVLATDEGQQPSSEMVSESSDWEKTRGGEGRNGLDCQCGGRHGRVSAGTHRKGDPEW